MFFDRKPLFCCLLGFILAYNTPLPGSAAKTGAVGLYPSILVSHKPHHRSGIQQLTRVAQRGFREVQLVVTLRCQVNQQREVVSYGTMTRGQYRPLDDQSLDAFRKELLAVCQEAKRLKLRVNIQPHLDTGGELYDWRNRFDFDPLKFYRDHSYDQAMLESIILALHGAGYADQPVRIALGGEMGTSLFRHGDSYASLLVQLHRDRRLTKARWGIGLNYSEVAGLKKPSQEQATAVQQFLDKCDFLGISHYRPFKLPPLPQHFPESAAKFISELADLGVKVPANLPLVFSEVAIGGGGFTATIAEDPLAAAGSPWEGSSDPRQNPWATPEMRQLRLDYHEALLKYLSNPTAHQQRLPNPVVGAYLWSEGSWDPLDTAEDGFVDEEIAAAIAEHNEAVILP